MSDQNNETISRRNVLMGMGAIGAMAYAGNAAAMKGHEGHAHHDHSKHKTQHPRILESISDCSEKGQQCTAHCMISFVEGSTDLAKCASKVQEMMSVCGGYSYLVAANSEYSKEYGMLCKKVCQDCADECLEHKDHKECRDCGKACEALIREIDKAFG